MKAQGLVLFVSLALAGCAEPPTPPPPDPPAPAFSATIPTMTKDAFTTPMELPLPEILRMPTTTLRTIEIPAGSTFAQVAIDLLPLDPAIAMPQASAQLRDPGGAVVHEIAPASGPAKGIAILDAPASGAYELAVVAKGSWRAGVVVVTFPAGHTPGLFVNVSYPEQRSIDHTFEPSVVKMGASSAVRLTLFDHDPHEGIENLQHNLFIPALNVKTDAQTTWGEVRQLDLVAPAAPGAYDFYCEYHEGQLRGTILVG